MAQQTMKGYLFSKSSKPTLVYKEDLPVPTPRAGTVVVKVSALWVYPGLAHMEAIPSPLPAKPFIPGADAVGIIESVGPDVFNLRKGQRVVISRHVIAHENVPEPAQALVGGTSFHPDTGGVNVLEAFSGMFQICFNNRMRSLLTC
jgi:NADPH:quinone reductase-like Zn-dependent oxidoreductase